MGVQLDHFIVASRDKLAAAKLLAEILDVPWAPSSFGVFAPVFLNEGLTLDFIDTDEDFPVEHYCFRVDEEQFKAILGRLKERGIPYRSEVRGPVDMQVGTGFGGKNVYWNAPDGHQWEMLTVSYARQDRT